MTISSSGFFPSDVCNPSYSECSPVMPPFPHDSLLTSATSLYSYFLPLKFSQHLLLLGLSFHLQEITMPHQGYKHRHSIHNSAFEHSQTSVAPSLLAGWLAGSVARAHAALRPSVLDFGQEGLDLRFFGSLSLVDISISRSLALAVARTSRPRLHPRPRLADPLARPYESSPSPACQRQLKLTHPRVTTSTRSSTITWQQQQRRRRQHHRPTHHTPATTFLFLFPFPAAPPPAPFFILVSVAHGQTDADAETTTPTHARIHDGRDLCLGTPLWLILIFVVVLSSPRDLGSSACAECSIYSCC
ncbi:hypothetical protein Mapa_014978 [Marchantia paleacea]|nr:hypothetical protein Mapa_014978 [Marchantia paleacea]